MTIYIVTDLGYGDAGKGTTVDYLARQGSAVVVRHSGGPQAGHNVVTDDGRHHEFAQFGSGTFAGAKTYLSEHMLVNPINMLLEAQHLIEIGVEDIWHRTFVDEQARLITPFHVSVNRIEESRRGRKRHGSCGQGVGVAMRQHLERPDLTIRVRDLSQPGLVAKLDAQQEYLRGLAKRYKRTPWHSLLSNRQAAITWTYQYKEWWNKVNVINGGLQFMLANHENVIFEGAQGVLLDEWYGFHPYTTWSTTTHENALNLLSRVTTEKPVRLGVTRAYMTRHGPGPFITEDPSLSFPEPHNHFGDWQGHFRRGHLDLPALKYAVEACRGVDQLVVTHLDQSSWWKYVDGYRMPKPMKGDLKRQEQITKQLLHRRVVSYKEIDSIGLLFRLREELQADVAVASYGPTASAKKVVSSVFASLGKS